MTNSEITAVDAWCERLRQAVPRFSRHRFGFRGAWRVNRQALGVDLLRAPLNVFYAPVWVCAQLLAWLLRRARLRRLARRLAALPTGWTTRVHRAVVADLQSQWLRACAPPPLSRRQQRTVASTMERYLGARNATAEISVNLLVLAIGYGLMHQLTPGGMGFGKALAQRFRLESAIESFWLGDAAGALWYGWFPPETPLALSLACIVLALAIIAFAAAFAGVLADPIQHYLGLHQRRLRRFVDALQRDLHAVEAAGYRPPEPYIARLFDGLDWLKLGS